MNTVFEELIPTAVTSVTSTLKGVTGHRIVCDPDGDGIFVVGGWNPSFIAPNSAQHVDRHYVREVWKFNVAKRTWSELSSEDPPESIASHCVANLGPAPNTGHYLLLIHGGSLSARGIMGNSNDTFIYDVTDEQWTKLNTAGTPPVRENGHWFGQAMAKRGNYVYVANGRETNDRMEIHRLNLENLIWEALSVENDRAPGPRVRHEIVVDELENVYIIGGGIDFQAGCYDLKDIPYFDVKTTKRWNVLNTLPDPVSGYPKRRSCFGCVIHQNYVYVVAGYSAELEMPATGDYPAPETLNDLWRLHLPTGQWMKFQATLPQPLWFHSVDVDGDGVLYVYGGCTDTGYISQRSTRLWRTRLVPQPLKRLAWDAVLKYVSAKNLAHMSDGELQEKLSLPNTFIKKVNW